MSLQKLAQQVRAKGRHGDTELVHMAPSEVAGLHKLARAIGEQGLSVNPETGLHEAFSLKSLLPSLIGGVAGYFGGPAAGALAGAAVGGYQARKGGGENTLAGMLAGGMGGYGAAQGVQGFQAAAQQGLTGGNALDAAKNAGPLQPAVEEAAARQLQQQQQLVQQASFLDKAKAGISALMTPEGREAAVKGMGGNPMQSLGRAALPLGMVDPAEQEKAAAAKRPGGNYTSPYAGQQGGWEYDANGVLRWMPGVKKAAGGVVGYAEGGPLNGANVTSDALYAYLNGLAESPRVHTLQQKTTPRVREAAAAPGDGGAPGGLGGPTGGSGGTAGFGGMGGASMSGDYAAWNPGTTGGAVGDIGQGAGSVSGDAGLSADTIENIGSGIGLVTGIPGVGTILDKTGAAQSISDWLAAQAGQSNRDSVASVGPSGSDDTAQGYWVDSAPVRGEVQGTTAADTGAWGTNGGAAAQAGADAAAEALANGASDAEAAEIGQAMADAVLGAGAGNAAEPTLPATPPEVQHGFESIAVDPSMTFARTELGYGFGSDMTGTHRKNSSYNDGGPVALQSGGFVFPADVVAALGAGSSGAGLDVLAKRFGARPVQGKGHGQSDDVHATIDGQQPARVARDEAVLDAEQVARIGGGDPKKGAKKLYDMMARVRKQATGSNKQMRVIDPNKALR